ncbi:cytochrome c biogenesis protein CcsA [Candidatus Oleimmundimicrobium sp.]|uniref:cytochrome c biogenesis protein n=1 Tax=Candidatus Oleimmundimicrobium sp. TaxID=3060597 RepID=UPI002715FF34|nr:cytochrome c biogenesis protein CcsA [Candidatus Oleimmundimicrobium sp.]MDO8886877.1 cytochrome c biogenesis protein CcsA [Candidatus Oleimmundimicrobium sp.]
MKNKIVRGFLGMASFIGIFISLYMAFFYAPLDKNLGVVQKIFYIHFPVAIVPYFAFLVVFICSIIYLKTRDRKWDKIAYASAEIGLVIDTALLVTGTIFVKPTWGVWWVWEPRLTTSLIMWLLYAGYLMLYYSVDDIERKSRLTAVFGIVAFISVPISFMSIRWWRSAHPLMLAPKNIALDTPMWITTLVFLASMTLFYLYLLGQRIRMINLQEEIQDLKDEIGG